MINRDGVKPFDVNPRNQAALNTTCATNPFGLKVKGWELLESGNLAHFAKGEERRQQSRTGRAIEVGLGFGVGLAAYQLEINRPDCDISPFIAFPLPNDQEPLTVQLGEAFSSAFGRGGLSVYRSLGANLGWMVIGGALPQLKMETGVQVRIAQTAIVFGYNMVVNAYQCSELARLESDPSSLDTELLALLDDTRHAGEAE